ncbi:MAG TPA: hypothetical protein VLH61_00255 [Bacteroidales bacterium]|nr:hypothetical protein [Bacteroidales bacterium]
MKLLKNYPVDLKTMLPYIVAVGLFLMMSVIYVHPILGGKQLLQPDIVKFQGMAKEISDFREVTGEEALWTNSMFGGMPAFQISVVWKYNIANFFHNVMTLWLPRPADMIFLYFAGFFIFLLLLKVNPWVALVGSLAFAFSSYHFIIIQAGHNSKAVAIAYMAPVLASVIYAFRGKLLAGGLLFAIFMGLQVFANHYQITYYLGIMVFLYGLFELYHHYKEKLLARYFKAIAVLVGGLIIALGINIGSLWATFTFAEETMRGGSELTVGDREPTEGLSKDYITQWSYGLGETFSLLIPNVKGGATGALDNNPVAMEAVEPAFRSFVAQQNHYWGNQPFTSGPVYVGAIVLFLFFLGVFYLKGPLKWGLLLSAILAILLSWGYNFPSFTGFFIEHIPLYDSFRAVTMILVIVELAVPALAVLFLQQLVNNPGIIKWNSREFLGAFALTAGLAFLFFIMPKAFFSFTSNHEAEFFAGQIAQNPQAEGQIRNFLMNLENARVAVFKADAIRSFLFVLAASVAVLLFVSKKIKILAFLLVLGSLITLDMWPVNNRYLNENHFQPRRNVETPFRPTEANLQILQDRDLHFRVFNTTVNTFNESSTSWFHRSIGGYHGAKLQRFQDIIDKHLTVAQVNMNVLNMLNTKYFIVPGENQQPQARLNPEAMGNAWFVTDLRMVENADEEILALNDFNPDTTAIIDRRFSAYVEGKQFQPDTLATIQLMEYAPNRLRYQYQTATQQVAVFSEIFYPHDWKVTINGEPAGNFRVNYILRALVIPAGSGEIIFEFRPAAYFTGSRVSWFFSTLLLLLVAAYLWRQILKNRKKPVMEEFDKQ